MSAGTTGPDVDAPATADGFGIGASRQRPDGLAKLRGRFEYSPDLYEEGMLWGATLRSPHAHARLRTLDLAPAKALPGVHAVLGAWDVADNRYGAINRDTPVLADDIVRFQGEPIAIVAAEDRETARRALALIEVEYEVLTPITDPVVALAEGKVYRHVDLTYGDPSVVGEVQAEGEYATARQDHSFLAPDGGIARPDGRGGVIVTGATQWVFSDRDQIAPALGLPPEMVTVVNSGVGGAFGGRFVLSWQIHGALLALHTNRPVKMLYTRAETFLARYQRQPSRIWIRHHAKRDGTIVKLEARVLYENGPYSNTAAAALGNGSSLVQGPYKVPNARVEGWAVATNNGMTGSLRGFGVVEPMYACESNMDNLARVLEMDPIELRRRNAMVEGERWMSSQLQNRPTPVTELIDDCDRMPRPAADSATLPGGPATPSRPGDVRRGEAFSAAVKNVCLSEGAPLSTTSLITLRDGVAYVNCAAAEVGQGFWTVAIQVVQSALGVTDIRLGGCDSTMPLAATTDGQQQTMTSGASLAVTADSLKRRFLRFYSREHSLDPADLDIVADHVVDRAGNRLASVADAGMGLVFNATETFTHRRTRPLEDSASPDPMHVAMNFSASRVVVDVDAELGLTKVVQIDVTQDPGRVVNPAQARGQIEGGVVMGMGLAVMEALNVDNGRISNGDWESYLVPTTMDVPDVNVAFIEHPEPGIPFGLRGIAELPHVQSPPVVAQAVRNAVDKSLPRIPLTPEVVTGHQSGGLDSLFEVRPRTIGPWQVPRTRTDVGPWKATLPLDE